MPTFLYSLLSRSGLYTVNIRHIRVEGYFYFDIVEYCYSWMRPREPIHICSILRLMWNPEDDWGIRVATFEGERWKK